MRAFLAVAPDEEARSRLDAVGRELRRRVPHGVSWVAPSLLHLTLAFLGEVDPTRGDSAMESAREVAAGAAPFDVTLAGLGAFPDELAPRVVFASVAEGRARLAALADELAAALRARGFALDERAYNPHVTLARPRRTSGVIALAAAFREVGARMTPLTLRVDAIVLFESNHDGVVRYRPVSSVALRG